MALFILVSINEDRGSSVLLVSLFISSQLGNTIVQSSHTGQGLHISWLVSGGEYATMAPQSED